MRTETEADLWPGLDDWEQDPLDPQLPAYFWEPAEERSPLPGTGIVPKKILDEIGLFSGYWGLSVLHRWADNVEAERTVRPPAFTFPDGKALQLDGRPF